MDLGAVNDDWKLIDLGNGLYNIQNTVRGNYMEWYAQHSNPSTYNPAAAPPPMISSNCLSTR